MSLEEISSEEGSVIGEEEKKPSKKDFLKKYLTGIFRCHFKVQARRKIHQDELNCKPNSFFPPKKFEC